MTDRDPTDDDRVLEALEADPGRGGRSAAPVVDKALQEEIDGLRAVQALLKADTSWGERSGTDAPPPQLLDAILRAEVAARPDAIRQAVAAHTGGAPAAPAPSWWSRVSSWAVGGGVVVAAAAAVVVTVSRGPSSDLAAAPQHTLRAAQHRTEEAADTGAFAPPAGQAQIALDAEDVLKASGQNGQNGQSGPRGPDRKGDDVDGRGQGEGGMAPEKGLDDDARGVDQFVGGLVETRARKGAAVASAVSSPSPASPSSPLEPSPPSPPPSPSPPLAASTEKASASGAALADDESRAEAEPPPEAAASSGPESAPRVVSATEAANSFLKTKLAAKEAAAESKKSESASAPGTGSRRSVAEEARASVERERRLNDANGALVTAERELQLGRFASALDLATQAEALARGGLGLAPTSTRVRALWALARAAEAAALAEGLLTVPASSTQLVDGLLAGADAALAVGDMRLRTRLLTKAASTENPDPARRAEAKRRLSSSPGTKAQSTAPTKATSSADEPAAADTR